jgi:hypothetical protein
MPRYSVMVPMVTMIEGRRCQVTRSALKPPGPAPAATPSAIATGIGSPALAARANRQVDSAIIAATDRSISPETTIMVRTRATMPNSIE